MAQQSPYETTLIQLDLHQIAQTHWNQFPRVFVFNQDPWIILGEIDENVNWSNFLWNPANKCSWEQSP